MKPGHKDNRSTKVMVAQDARKKPAGTRGHNPSPMKKKSKPTHSGTGEKMTEVPEEVREEDIPEEKKSPKSTNSDTAEKMDEAREEDLPEETDDDDEDQSQQDDEVPVRRSIKTSGKSIGRRSPVTGNLVSKKKLRIQSKPLVHRYQGLVSEEVDSETKVEFSPGPNQAKPTQMMKLMKQGVERRVEIELQRRSQRTKPSVAKKLFEDDSEQFVSPEDDKEAERSFRRRMEEMMDTDAILRED